MPKDFPRSLRVAEQIHREVTMLLRDQVNDPRVKGFSISEVIVNKDLSTAKIYYSPYSDSFNNEELQDGLNSCSAFLRKELGRLLHMRVIPKLSFHFDDIPERSARLEELLAKEKPTNK
ncbi:MAG: 30S ribosome-binding factor RbfA [Pseudomonadota bacterium]